MSHSYFSSPIYGFVYDVVYDDDDDDVVVFVYRAVGRALF